MFKVLFGSLKVNKPIDLLKLIFKVLYIIYTLPFLIFVLLMHLRSLGAFGNPPKEEFGIMKKILLHISAIFLSFCLWIAILSILEAKLGLKVRLHLF